MSTNMINLLKQRRISYVNKITVAEKKITSLENAHDSLTAFKRIVTSSQENFQSLNSNKKNILTNVSDVKKYSVCAQKYYTGMKGTLNNIGTTIIGAVYSALLASISLKLKGYVSSVDSYENDIAAYNEKISEIDQEIATLEALAQVTDTSS